MSQVETIALWTGLIAGIASIVLSIVAIAFAFVVNTRSTDVSDQTIRSLQKIESQVERQSEDTNGLIKAAWDKMIGGTSGGFEVPRDEDAADRLVSGLSAEVREAVSDDGNAELVERLDRALERLEQSLSAQIGRPARSARPATALDDTVARLRSLAGSSVALLDEISSAHLSRQQYIGLEQDGYLGSSINQLREAGLLVPLTGADEPLVYWFPPGTELVMRTALTFLRDDIPDAVFEAVRAELSRVEYPLKSEPTSETTA